MRLSLLLSFLSLSLACSGDKADSGDAVPVFRPADGSWSWSSLTYTTDDCNLEPAWPAATLEAIVWTLESTETGFDIATTTGDPISCEVSMMDFTCATTLVTDITEWPEDSGMEGDPDVTTTALVNSSGSFSDDQTGSGSIQSDVTCEGTDCEVYLEMMGSVSPCTTTVEGDFLRSM